MPAHEVTSGIWPYIGGGEGKQLCVTSTGRLWCCYEWDNNVTVETEVWVAFSDDNGVTWTNQVMAANPGFSYTDPAIAVDSLDRVHIVYDNRDTDIPKYRRYNAGAWEAELDVDVASAVTSTNPVIAIDSADNIHIAYRWDAGVGPREIRYRRRAAAGVWGVAEAVTAMGGALTQRNPAIAVDKNDVVHLTWSGTGYGVNAAWNNIQYRQRIGGVWQVREPVTDAASQNHPQDIALDSTNEPYIAWSVANTVSYVANRAAGVWPIQTFVDIDTETTIAFDRADNIYLMGINQAGTQRLRYTKFSGGVWSAVQIVGSVELANANPKLMWACWPNVGGVQTNVMPEDQFSMVYYALVTGAPLWTTAIYYFHSVRPPIVQTLKATGRT